MPISWARGMIFSSFQFPVLRLRLPCWERRQRTNGGKGFQAPGELQSEGTAAEAEVWVCTGPVGASRSTMQADVCSEGKRLHSPDGQGAWHLPSTCFLTVSAPRPHSSIGHPWFSDFGLGTHFHPSLPGLSMSRVPRMLLHPGPLGSLHLYYHCSHESGVGYHG